MKKNWNPAVLWAILSAALYAVNVPMAKLLLLNDVSPIMMAAFLYLGAGAGMCILGAAQKATKRRPAERPLTRKELPYGIGMILMDSAAPILLMIGLAQTTPANVSLLSNFEIVATALIASAAFREKISRRLWLAIGLIVLSSAVLSLEGSGSFHFSLGSVFVLLACTCWGVENNCTRRMSACSPLEIVVIKGFGAGAASLLLAIYLKTPLPEPYLIPDILLLGFVSYGLSIFLYVYAQRYLGAARTSAFYATAPFIGVLLSLLMFQALPGLQFFIALAIMAVGAYLAAIDSRQAQR